jgi:ribosomal protein L11 methyltransferase
MNSNQQLIVTCNPDYSEILIAELSMIGFESFQETEEGFIAHPDVYVDQNLVKELFDRYQKQTETEFWVEDIVKENWNRKWEESYEPIIVEDKCIVRASFHEPQPNYPIEVVINPRMSFGTGHHETTYLMMASQLDLKFKNKSVLDAGCGTGILSILAGKMGSIDITLYDNDEWVEDNIQENLKINGVNARVLIGTVQSIKFDRKFDVILANINKNILLNDIPYYATLLKKGGNLLMSGFYKKDLNDIVKLAGESRLQFVDSNLKNDWAMIRLVKP